MRSLLLAGLLASACGSVDSGRDGAAVDSAGGDGSADGPGQGSADGALLADTPASCMGVVDACSSDAECDPSMGLRCWLAGDGSGVCAPERGTCGGFAGAECTAAGALNCLYLTGTDYGLCASDPDRACICGTRTPAIA